MTSGQGEWVDLWSSRTSVWTRGSTGGGIRGRARSRAAGRTRGETRGRNNRRTRRVTTGRADGWTTLRDLRGNLLIKHRKLAEPW